MGALLTALVGKMGAAGLSVLGASALAGLVIAVGRPRLQKLISSEIAKGLSPNVADPKEKELLADLTRAFIRYAEHKLPDRGGDAKKAMAVQLLAKYLPGASAEAVGRVVQEVFDTLDDELKKKL